MSLKRIDKLIALNCNVTRKEARQLIKDGVVSVNGNMIYRAEELVDSACDTVTVQGHTFCLKDHIYIMMNKPQGVITATEDPRKETVIDLVPPELARRSLFPCGRLDRDTTGLLLITDDGEFCHKIMSPSHHVYKTYIAQLARPLSDDAVKALEEGILLDDGTQCLPAKIKYYEENGLPFAEIKIREGKYHQVKRMMCAVGNHVERLDRVRVGDLKLDTSLQRGECREITQEELQMVFNDDSSI